MTDNRRPYPMNLIDDLDACVVVAQADLDKYSRVIAQIESELADGQTVDRAISIITRDYASDVASVAREMADLAASGECDRDTLLERLYETIDGHSRVIYYAQARQGLLVSDNADAFAEDFGGAPENECQAMFAAMERDVMEHPDFPDDGEWDYTVTIDTGAKHCDSGDLLDAARTILASSAEHSTATVDLARQIDCDWDPDPEEGTTGLAVEYTSDAIHALEADRVIETFVGLGVDRRALDVDE